jgi:hypothetical protein
MESPKQDIPVRIVVVRPPRGVRFQLQKGHAALRAPTHEGGDCLVFDFTLRVGPPQTGGQPNLLGEFAQGPPRRRFVYVNSGVRADQTDSCWDRRAKVSLGGITMEQIGAVLSTRGSYLEASIEGTARDGGPACAAVPLLEPGWRVQTEEPSNPALERTGRQPPKRDRAPDAAGRSTPGR